MYRYNSRFHQVIGDFIYPVYKVTEKGYIPLEGEMDTMKINENYDPNIPFRSDSLKLYYINKLIESLGETRIIFIVSPSWYNVNPERFKSIKLICDKYGIPFLDYSNDDLFLHNNDYFKDGLHMNTKGADEFTKKIMQDINNNNTYE